MYDHKYAVDTSRHYPFQDLITQVNRLPDDHSYASDQPKLSKSIQAAGSQVKARTSKIAVESVPHQDVNQDLAFVSCLSHDLYVMNSSKETSHELSSASVILDCNSEDVDPLSTSDNICVTSESVHISPPTASLTIQELQDELKKQKKEIEALQRDNKLLSTITQKTRKKLYILKSNYDKCRLRLWRSEQSKAKVTFGITSRLHADQIASLGRQSNRGLKWSLETIRDALVFKRKWGTTGYSDFVNYLPIFPSVRTLERTVENIKFESGILDVETLQYNYEHRKTRIVDTGNSDEYLE
ncbi:uncharacterized protein [Temnothorax nylanderi]|uniref:uncharacterized protein isoform X2 n=1 Tax=Temnothorax nylanderi TaxID=102681 RepID=UPI003A8837AD